jgi:hypothetical protein
VYLNRIGTSGELCEHGNEPSISIKGGDFLDQLSEMVVEPYAFWGYR